jgi:curli biogenesis system outer membrane secretion channel CsgG
MQRIVPYSILLFAVAIFLLPATNAAAKKKKDSEKDLREEIVYPEYNGPKKTIAVAKFDAHGAFVAKYGGWDVGGGLSAMLVGELLKTNRFIVVERAELDAVLKEQELGLTEVTTKQVPVSGKLLGAQLLIRGSVTEFDQESKGGGFSIGIRSDNKSGAVGKRSATGHVAIDLRLIDTTSGQILENHTVSQKLKTKSASFSGGVDKIVIGGDRFNETSVGLASRAAIREAVQHIIAAMDTAPWQGLVAKVEGKSVFVNAGKNANLTPGQRMECIRMFNVITDPATGEQLGGEIRQVCEFVLSSVEDRYAVGTIVGPYSPKIGDTVRMVIQ